MPEAETQDPPAPAEGEGDAGSAPDELGEAGKKALAAERKAARDADRRAKVAEAELERIRLENATDAEKAVAAAKAEGRNEALSVANARIVKAEIKAAASGVLQDPDDAIAHIDPSQFEVDDDGNVDTKAIKAEIKRLADAKPYLSAGAKPAPLPGGGATSPPGVSMDDWMRSKKR